MGFVNNMQLVSAFNGLKMHLVIGVPGCNRRWWEAASNSTTSMDWLAVIFLHISTVQAGSVGDFGIRNLGFWLKYEPLSFSATVGPARI